MATQTESEAKLRAPLTRARVLDAAIALADGGGIESLSMRKLGQELGVEAMSLYNHVANKEDLLDGMVDVILSEIGVSSSGPDWKAAMRQQVLTARGVMERHPWAAGVIESRTTLSSPMLAYMDSIVGILLGGGFSIALAHHAMHAMGSRLLGFAQELFDDSGELAESPEVAALLLQQMSAEYPNLSVMLKGISHDDDSVIGGGCDDQVEFVFGLDLILDGLERLRDTA